MISTITNYSNHHSRAQNSKHCHFYKRLIMRDYRQLKLPITTWASELRMRVQSLTLQALYALNDGGFELSNWFHQASLICIYSGRFHDARELCYAHIQIMLNMRQVDTRNDYSCQAYISWIMLARIDRLSKKYHEAAEKLNTFLRHRHTVVNNFDNDVVSASELFRRVKSLYQVEKIKLYFARRLERRLIAEFKNEISFVAGSGAFVIDSLILAYINTKRFDEALRLACMAQQDHLIHELAYLREQEIRWCYYNETMNIEKLSQMCSDRLMRMRSGDAQVNQVLFMLHLSRLFLLAKQNAYSSRLLDASIETAFALDDDMLKAEVYASYYHSGLTATCPSSLEDMMVSLYFNTHYPSARAILSRALPELKHVEINQDFHQLDLLLHDLLLLSASQLKG